MPFGTVVGRPVTDGVRREFTLIYEERNIDNTWHHNTDGVNNAVRFTDPITLRQIESPQHTVYPTPTFLLGVISLP